MGWKFVSMPDNFMEKNPTEWNILFKIKIFFKKKT